MMCDQKVPVKVRMYQKVPVKVRMYKTKVRRAILCGMEKVAVSREQEGKMEVAERKVVRYSLWENWNGQDTG